MEKSNADVQRAVHELALQTEQAGRESRHLEWKLSGGNNTTSSSHWDESHPKVKHALEQDRESTTEAFRIKWSRLFEVEHQVLQDKVLEKDRLIAQLGHLKELAPNRDFSVQLQISVDEGVKVNLEQYDRTVAQEVKDAMDHKVDEFQRCKSALRRQLEIDTLEWSRHVADLEIRLQTVKAKLDQQSRSALDGTSLLRPSNRLMENLTRLKNDYIPDPRLHVEQQSPSSSTAAAPAVPSSFEVACPSAQQQQVIGNFSTLSSRSLPIPISRPNFPKPILDFNPRQPAQGFPAGLRFGDVSRSPIDAQRTSVSRSAEVRMEAEGPTPPPQSGHGGIGRNSSTGIQRGLSSVSGQKSLPDTVPVQPFRSSEFLVSRKEQNRDKLLNPVKKAIRVLTQELLGIKHDNLVSKAVQNGHFTTLGEATAYANQAGGAVQPTLHPFRPCWEDLKGTWNLTLQDLFVEHFMQKHPQYSQHEVYVRKHFEQRLETLRGAIMVQIRQIDQPDLREETASNNRRTERRRTLFHRRKTWAEHNLETFVQSDGHDTIQLLLEMLKLLGTDGMSSDESDTDLERPCTVVGKGWRCPDVVRLLKWIDLRRPKHTVYGERKPGNAPHRRLRLPYGKAPKTLRRPIANLPENFYDRIWYQGLSSGQKTRLGATEEQALPLYILTWPKESLPKNVDDQDEY
ncbi:hypothetical protein B0H16DRAFT_1744820 [Mycena metata]|uniref:Uncharacterized protein n=1 Tax=Mycena metata TaxID=1033252 RepID=A0AAD7MD79_9AGAR|nr:hypothetical protein B0H16DRAFT_1744820 [Mycena metata]